MRRIIGILCLLLINFGVSGLIYAEQTDVYLDTEKDQLTDKVLIGTTSNRQSDIILLEKGLEESSSEINVDSIVQKYGGSAKFNERPATGPFDITKSDLRFVKGPNGEYYDLYIKKKPQVHSILLTNYYWDYSQSGVREYGLRDLKYNSVNGDEKRFYKGMFIGKKQKLYFLVDSNPKSDLQFGQAFHIRIPKYVVYGYKYNRETYSVVRLKSGFKFNIRAFARKYSDYKGKYEDNPIRLILDDAPIQLKNRPMVVKVKEVLEDEFLAVYVEYQNRDDFFRSFVLRRESDSSYQEIDFNNKYKQHAKAVLLEAFYKDGIGRILRAIVYLKRYSEPRNYYISSIDKNGLQAVEQIMIKVPAFYSSYNQGVGQKTKDPSQKQKNNQVWYEEGQF